MYMLWLPTAPIRNFQCDAFNSDPEDALALVQLIDHVLLELAVAAQSEVLGIALHLDQVVW